VTPPRTQLSNPQGQHSGYWQFWCNCQKAMQYTWWSWKSCHLVSHFGFAREGSPTYHNYVPRRKATTVEKPWSSNPLTLMLLWKYHHPHQYSQFHHHQNLPSTTWLLSSFDASLSSLFKPSTVTTSTTTDVPQRVSLPSPSCSLL